MPYDKNSILNFIEKNELNEIHKFSYNGKNILLNVKESDFYDLDETTNTLFDYIIGNIDKNKIEGLTDIELSSSWEGILDSGVFNRNSDLSLLHPIETNNYPINNIVINLIHNCNLRCKYCFADKGLYNQSANEMSASTLNRAIDWSFENSLDSDEITFLLFGGEPLLSKRNVFNAVETAKNKGVMFNKKVNIGISTNGTILDDDYINLFKEYDVSIQISIDGPQKVHDKLRSYPNGTGSYSKIISNLELLFKNLPKKNVIPRATISNKSTDIYSISNHLFGLGFEMVFIAPALGCGDYVLKKSNISSFIKSYKKLVNQFISGALQGDYLHVFPLLTEVLNIGGGIKRRYGCGAGLGFSCISSEGEIFPCMRFVNIKECSLGHINNGILPKQRKKFAHRIVDNRESCKKCWARYFCGGSCVAVPQVQYNNFMNVSTESCEIVKNLIELSMYVNTVLTENGIFLDESIVKYIDFVRRRVQ